MADDYSPWSIDAAEGKATLDFMGGVLTVYRRADGAPEAHWTGSIAHPPAFMALHPEAQADGVTGSTPELTTFLHFAPSLVAAMDLAPGAIRSHHRQAYPHHFAAHAHAARPRRLMPSPADLAAGATAPADPF